LELALVRQAPDLIKLFKTRAYRNVGVLKFLVSREGEGRFSDNVGPLNMALAHRLEVALLLANDPRMPVGILRNPSAVAVRVKGANHLTPQGRKPLFEADYPLAWGRDEVKADAFVTGTAQISKDLKTLTLSLMIADRAGNKLAELGKDFLARNDAGKLAEMNESFLLRGIFDDARVVLEAFGVKQRKKKHPLATPEPPVGLEILYDDKPVGFEFRNGRAFVPEPREKQKVAFRLPRDGGKDRYGVVLKVNGENTIGRERGPDLHCRRWILEPGSAPLPVRGYQIDGTTAEQFRVLSRAESEEQEINYGSDVGTISLTVFRERKTEEVIDGAEPREERNARIVSRMRVPEGMPVNYNLLKQKLLEEGNNERRGLIGEGEKVESRVRVVSFDPDPTPVMSVTVIYYQPKR
jgi:hypothetical protein